MKAKIFVTAFAAIAATGAAGTSRAHAIDVYELINVSQDTVPACRSLWGTVSYMPSGEKDKTSLMAYFPFEGLQTADGKPYRANSILFFRSKSGEKGYFGPNDLSSEAPMLPASQVMTAAGEKLSDNRAFLNWRLKITNCMCAIDAIDSLRIKKPEGPDDAGVWSQGADYWVNRESEVPSPTPPAKIPTHDACDSLLLQ
jgi:hypothetical protein